MIISDPDLPCLASQGPAADALRAFDGHLSLHFHAIRMALKRALIVWHQTRSATQVVERLRVEATPFANVYSAGKPLTGLRDEFEYSLAMAVALTNEREIALQLKQAFSFEPKGNGYGYYIGYKNALLGLILDDDVMQQVGRQYLSQFNAAKTFYFPSDTVMFAALDGDMKALKAQVKAINKKFDGYAKKCEAISGDTIRIGLLDQHWFSPYPDWAFYAQAIRRHGRLDAEDSFWMPIRFLNSFAANE